MENQETLPEFETYSGGYTKLALNGLATQIYHSNLNAGWWNDLDTGELLSDPGTIAQKLLLMHSEISEATEGFRKDLMDDHLPHRKSLEVELADTMIRILDLAGRLNLDIGGALVEKWEYNTQRADHKVENRLAQNGKKF